MRGAAIAFAALLCCSCVSSAQRPREFYLSARPYTFASAGADSAELNLPERLVFQFNEIMRRSRRDDEEKVACFKVRTDGVEFWAIGDLLDAWSRGRTETHIADFQCPKGYGVVHTHPLPDDGSCAVAGDDLAPAKAGLYPVWVVACGYGVDSLIAYRVKRR